MKPNTAAYASAPLSKASLRLRRVCGRCDLASQNRGLEPRRSRQNIIGEITMKYLCLVYGEENRLEEMGDDECVAYDEELRHRGQCLASEALQPVETAVTVRVRNSRLSISDGPFAETKETLAGFYLINARDLNEAIQVASKIPPARVGSVEVRPIRELAGRRDGSRG